MIGGMANKVVNTTFRWSGMEQGRAGMMSVASAAAAVAAAGVAATAAVWRLADRTTQLYGEFYDLSQRLGIGASQLHAIAIAAEQDGVALDGVTMAFRRMPSAIQDLERGLSTATDTFDALGLTLEDLAGKSMEEQFYTIGDALMRVTDESTRAALANDVFGRSGMNMIPFLQRGSDGMRELADAARESGRVLDDETYAAADAFQDKLVELKAEINGMVMEAIEPSLPMLTDLAEGFVDIAAEGIPALVTAATNAIPVITELARLMTILLNSANKWASLAQWIGNNLPGAGWMNNDEETYTPITELAPVPQPGTFTDIGLTGINAYGRYSAAGASGVTESLIAGGPSAAAVAHQAYNDTLANTPALLEDIRAGWSEIGEAASGAIDLSSGGGGGGMSESELRERAIMAEIDAMSEQQDVIASVGELRIANLEQYKSMTDETYENENRKVYDLFQDTNAQITGQMDVMASVADASTQLFSAAWDSMFNNTRVGFDQLLKDMLLALVKSGILKLIKGFLTGGTGILF